MTGRPSIPPERMMRELHAFYTVRSETQLMEQLEYNLLYRWFVGLGVDETVWVPTVFTKNRDRLLEVEVARKFLVEFVTTRRWCVLLSGEHFSVDGTQIVAWASISVADLMSQPTLSRLENLANWRALARIGLNLIDLFCKSYARPPTSIVLDIDARRRAEGQNQARVPGSASTPGYARLA